MQKRRQFIGTMAATLVAGVSTARAGVHVPQTAPFPISCNEYNWYTFFSREGRDWYVDKDASLKEFSSTGIKAFEPSLNSEEEVKALLPLLKKHGISLPSVYVGSVLHDTAGATADINKIVSVAKLIAKEGTKILVTNPNPIRWGGDEAKSDEQLITQATNLSLLAKRLKEFGITLAYHNHDIELRHAAREFHHMMTGTDPQLVKFCLDAHWIYRGSGNSQVALFDVLKMYGKRIVEIHLRQSVGGVWSETFGPGDIDYGRLANELKTMKVYPHLVLEQCVEDASPSTTNAVDAHRAGLKYTETVFASLRN